LADTVNVRPLNHIPSESIAGSPATILLVDDDPIVSRFLHDFLSRDGHLVTNAADGVEAFETLARSQSKVNLVITDMVMPGMGGSATISRLREKYPEIKVIAMSGSFSGDVAGLAAHLQVHSVLRKPFRPADLLSTVRTAVGV
jgi:CheY-like chemotaxis protein